MNQAEWQRSQQARVASLLSGVPFFNEVSRDDADQRALLLAATRILEAAPGELVIKAGAEARGLYFLLRGELWVLGEGSPPPVVYRVSPGEVFGALSLLLETPRSASLKVAEGDQAKPAVLARLSFADFDAPSLALFSLATRLALFHMLVHQIRWAVEVQRLAAPDAELEAALRKIPLYQGEKETVRELAALREQARALAALLCRWNDHPRAGPAMT
ncbi:hypothetical protein A6D6_02360 [Alcanivorax xiamenensis]|uniref:Cyclic nucleotide-binding domain-containing protein n=1 Tax=Alcanivorax xiamenensis TaxID=1177156 RepID=A0ABQ6Y7E9_9GAMM|nr:MULTISPECIES: cyclic nucleotide-binding domain-containing protein [Alcanivorax]KAF0805405.1 hypothetical protein A6D6_02360 [Alcanivorax xiamenensis]